MAQNRMKHRKIRKKITISLPEDLQEKMQKYMNENFFTNTSEFIRMVLRDFFKKEGI